MTTLISKQQTTQFLPSSILQHSSAPPRPAPPYNQSGALSLPHASLSSSSAALGGLPQSMSSSSSPSQPSSSSQRGRPGPLIPDKARTIAVVVEAEAVTSTVKDNLPSSLSDSASAPPPHPSLRSDADPMKEEQKKKTTTTRPLEEDEEQKRSSTGVDSSKKLDRNPNNVSGDKETETNHSTKKRKNRGSENASYYYRSNYAWMSSEHFFNKHLDDSWFRQLYSPALLVKGAKLERRTTNDAGAMLKPSGFIVNSSSRIRRGIGSPSMTISRLCQDPLPGSTRTRS